MASNGFKNRPLDRGLGMVGCPPKVSHDFENVDFFDGHSAREGVRTRGLLAPGTEKD